MIIIMAIQILQQTCELLADYSATQVPVTVVYDEANSIPIPGPGQLQTFCYTVTQVSEPFGLSHWVLVICPDITIDDLGEVTVTIDGVAQTVIKGTNVVIQTDPTTQCTGLKFDFGLGSDAGTTEMDVCFQLKTTHQIGPNIVCVKGGQVTENSLSICGPVCGIIEECDTTVFQKIGVCVPITITPFAKVGAINVTCCGGATISTTPCPENGPNCTFYVSRSVCVEVPIVFGATGDPGTAVVSCGTASETECDCSSNG